MQFFTPHLFGEIGAPATLADLVPLVERWKPDLLVHDSFEFAGPVAGRLAGIPTVHHTVSPLPGADVQRLTSEAVAPMWRERGLAPEPAMGSGTNLCLDICPPSLRNGDAVVGGQVLPLRPVPATAAQPEPMPSWAASLPEQPTVHVTLGTSVTNADQSVLTRILDGLRAEALNVVVTVGPGNDPAALGEQPPNVHVERYLPHSLLLPLCDLVVSHGGAGTMLAALSHGLPLLSVPQGADQYFNAEICEARGVGHTLVVGDLTPERAHSEVKLLLDDPGVRQRAREVQAEIAAMPAADDVVRELERIAGVGH
jgi:UDP:flavonoid glycosyltransferase YjiC (YdhE family)